MKHLLLFIMMILIASQAYSEDRKSKRELMQAIRHYQRLMESAQPLPEAQHLKPSGLPSILSPASKSAIFLNSNTIDDESAEVYKMQNESSIAVNPTNPMNLIASAVDYRGSSSTWVYVSDDGGKSWRNINLGKAYPGWRSSNDPSVYFALDGTGYLCYGGFGESIDSFDVSVGENGVFIAKTTDEGKTWKAHIPVIAHRGVQTLDSLFEDKYYVQVDNSTNSPYFGHIYIPWKRVTPRDSATQIVIAKSTDQGETWSIPKAISHRLAGSSEDTTFGQSFPLATTGPNGELYVVWNHGIEHSVGFVKSLDGGETFTEPRLIHKYNIFGTTTLIPGQGYRHTVKEFVRAEAYPAMVCDITNGPRRGNLYLCWAADNIPNIYFSKSTDKGETWSNPIIVHSDQTNDQFWPWISIDPLSGDLVIMYFDSRNDPQNLMVECYVSYSSDGGDTWTDRRAADQSSDLRLNPFTAKAFAGDYSGCAFYDGIAYPTWVDMRNAVVSLVDSDVFTAIVDTKAPLPIENFNIQIQPEKPQTLSLSWDNPTERSFGQALSNDDYKIHIIRNGEATHILDGGTNSLEDIELEAFSKYDYEIFTADGKHHSNSRFGSSYAGGAKEPATPVIFDSKGKENFMVTLFVQAPTKRADNFTPLYNLRYFDVYREGSFMNTYDVFPDDTGKVIKIADMTPRKGYYKYGIIAKDSFDNASAMSEQYIAYSDTILPLVEYKEEFDSAILPKYYIAGNWVSTDERAVSLPNSLTNAANKKYENGQCDTIMFFPFTAEGNSIYVSFYHSAFIANNDYGTVEYSTNKGIDWSNEFDGTTARWTKSDYSFWTDNVMDERDWKFEQFKLPESNDTIYVRWRFFSNLLTNDFGWYLDNIKFSTSPVSVRESDDSFSLVYPNPAKDFIKVQLPPNSDAKQFSLVSAVGAIALQGKIEQSSELIINLSNVQAGVYYLLIENAAGAEQRHKVMIVR